MDRAISRDVRSRLANALHSDHSLLYETSSGAFAPPSDPSEPFHPNCAGRRRAKHLLNVRSSPIRFLTSARPRSERESVPDSTNSLPTCRSKPMFARVLPVGHDNLCLTDASRSPMPLCDGKIATMPPSHRSYFNLGFTSMKPRSHIYETIACAWRWKHSRSAASEILLEERAPIAWSRLIQTSDLTGS